MSKEIHRLAQGKEGITKGTNTIFFLSHTEIRLIPADRIVTYARIVIDHRPQKDDPHQVRITVGGNLINYSFELTTRTTDMVSPKSFGTAPSAPKVPVLPVLTSKTCILRHHLTGMNI